ncbi:MAG: tRNA (adenosine(37)-N6)-dimethylallyltransferase MiaA [Anaerolineales bacterium]|nr:tRNA (adenosine(37)-N6)-dimethylallyltransferase MiaA [Anaerolineales bacterium]
MNSNNNQHKEQCPPLITIVGPTAVGKTKFSIELALRINGEIVSADSRLVYRGMNIGTAKPDSTEQEKVPHHLVDIVEPDDTLSLAEYQQMAYSVIDQIHHRNNIPLLVGGTGQYVRAVVEGWGIPTVPPNSELRQELETFANQHGADALHKRLEELDPAAAKKIDYRNIRRVIRALEVTMLAGEPISKLQTKKPPPFRILQIGLICSRPEIYQRIDIRIDKMIEKGLVDEVKSLKAGYGLDLPSMSGLGYRQIGAYLSGETDLETAIQLIRKETRRFVRQQSTWFRQNDPNIHWFNIKDIPLRDIIKFVIEWLKFDHYFLLR